MQRVVWLTDIHLNFVPDDEAVEFLLRVAHLRPDSVLISGDIAESRDVEKYLRQIAESLRCPIHFVLGNHDYYYGSIAAVRAAMRNLCAEVENLHYLTEASVVELAPGVGLIGHDGWADARYGDYIRSYVMMHDYRLIEDLAGLDKLSRREELHRLGDAAAAAIGPRLLHALEAFEQVFLVTHVPPVLEACWHEGQISDSQWSPHFTCKAMGDTILAAMADNPSSRLTVLCGHTHGSGETRPLPNVVIYTGGAVYGRPQPVRVFEL